MSAPRGRAETGRSKAISGKSAEGRPRIDLTRFPRRNDRYLRAAAVHCVVFTWLKSPEGDVHLPEGEGAKLTRRSIGTRVLRRPSVDRRLPVMAGRGSRLVLDPLQRAFRTLCGGPDGPITIRLT